MSGFDLSNFLASFFDEARERLASINQHLVNFESGRISDEELVELRRDAHTIKGSALMLGVKDVGAVGHLFEDAIGELIEHAAWRTPAMVQFLFDLHDRLAERLEDPDGNTLLEDKALRGRYNALLEALQGGEQAGSHEATAPADSKAVEVESPEEASDTDLIGADEAETWKKIKQEEEKLSLEDVPELAEKEPASTVFDAEEGNTEQAYLEQSVTPLPESAEERPDDFRPNIQQIEMKRSGQRKSSGRFLRVDAERLEELSNQMIELSAEQAHGAGIEDEMQALHFEMRTMRRQWRDLKNKLIDTGQADIQSGIQQLDETFAGNVRKTRYLVDEYRYGQERSSIMFRGLRDKVLSLMLKPLDSIFSTFPRAVRDTAVRLDKRVSLQIAGESVEIDQGVAETLVEPMVHLLNNAVAHGIESPEERRMAGKPEEGQVTIYAQQSGNEARIEVIDDGRGIDADMVKRTAVERGVTTQMEADTMDSAEILEMIFRPGFSTHSDIDEVAGRGIGMNVVQDAIRRLTGSIRIHTSVGQGSRFILSLPVRIAVQHALLFRMGNQRFGMLTHLIDQVIPLKTQHLERDASGKESVRYGEHLVPIVDLRPMLSSASDNLSDYPFILIAEHIEGFVGIVIDELYSDHEIVVRDLEPYIKRYQPQGIMGNTITADGSVLLLLEPYGIKEMGRTSPDDALDIQVKEDGKYDLSMLLVDDSLIARKIEQEVFEGLGFTVETAIDGMDALAKLDTANFDIVVTDLEMPRLDGFGLVRRMRNQPQYEDMPILIISTRESAEDRMRAMEAGADAYLVKQQLDSENLVKSLDMLIEPATEA